MQSLFNNILSVQGIIICSLVAFAILTLLISWLVMKLINKKDEKLDFTDSGKKFLRAPIALARLKSEYEKVPTPAEPSIKVSGEEKEETILSGDFISSLNLHKSVAFKASSAKFLGVDIAALFFEPNECEQIEDAASRLIPFAKPGSAKIISTEKSNSLIKFAGLSSEADAIIEIPTGLVVLEYKSRGGRLDSPQSWQAEIREKDILQTYIHALITSAATGKKVAPILRTNNALYFIRPSAQLNALTNQLYPKALDFYKVAFPDSLLPASDFASLLIPAVSRLWPKPETEKNAMGRAKHKDFLGQ